MATGVRRGDIRNEAYAWKAKTYSWGTLSKLFPRGISPTDIDGAVELNNKFLSVEFKTTGKDLDRGQSLFFERWLHAMRMRGFIYICEHASVEKIDPAEDIRRMGVWWWETTRGGVAKLNMFDANAKTVEWWFSEWVDHATGKPNNLLRACREKLGVYPESQTEPFVRVGGVVVQPPFEIRMQPSQTLVVEA